MRVIKSAKCIARTREKWPTSWERSIFCLSMAGFVSRLSGSFGHFDVPGDSEAFATLPLELAEARFDICATWLPSHC